MKPRPTADDSGHVRAAPSAASIPVDGLDALARFRDQADVLVLREEGLGRAWVRWTEPDDWVEQALRPVPGVVFFRFERDDWFAGSSRLPADELPPAASAMTPLSRAVVPSHLHWEEPASDWERVPCRLVPDDRPRPCTAVVSTADRLIPWSETLPSFALAEYRAAVCGPRILLLGANPPLVEGDRFWGDPILIPIGRRLEPELPAGFVADLFGVRAGDLAILTERPGGLDARLVDRDVCRPLSRAGLRLAARLEEGRP